MRLFIGINVSDQLKRNLTGLRHGLRRVKWVEQENYHITLQFLGEVVGSDYHQIISVLEEISAHQFSFKVTGLGHFQNRGKVHTLWAAVEAGNELYEIQDDLSRRLGKLGYQSDDKNFKPHITIGRAKNLSIHEAMEYIKSRGLFDFGPYTVESIQLFSSKLSSTGPTYTIEREFPLKVKN